MFGSTIVQYVVEHAPPAYCSRSRSTAFGPKGSYRTAHVVAFLERWLLPWTPDREASADYRLLYLDAFSAHLTDDVVECAWQRGYYVVFHGGCTTGVSQVNDTDLHAALEREYIDVEAISFYHQQKVDPGNIGRSRQQVQCEQNSCCVCRVRWVLNTVQYSRAINTIQKCIRSGKQSRMLNHEYLIMKSES